MLIYWTRTLNINCNVGDTLQATTVKERNLRISISAEMKISEQCGIAASKCI